MSLKLLLIEDSDEDFEVIKMILESLEFSWPLVRFDDGERALDYLKSTYSEKGASSSFPTVILLDLNLPGTDGRQILKELKSDLRLKLIPVVAMTTSDNPKDVSFCYEHGVNSYVTKPVDAERLESFLKSFVSYWFSYNLSMEHK